MEPRPPGACCFLVPSEYKMKKEVLIIGGGFSGLSAGVELSSRGYHVTVIERKGHLGGRAYSYKDPVSGSVMDNGQHILMGCYHDTLAFLEKIGTRDRVRFQRNLAVDFAGIGVDPVRFQSLPLPNPFHLLMGFLFFRGLSLRDKWSALKLAKVFRRSSLDLKALDQKSIPQWLGELGQTQQIQERFWNILTLAALNDRPEPSSAALLAAVLKEALFSGKKNACIGIPTVGLSDLYTEAARDYVEQRGGHFLMKSRVARVHFKGNEVQEVELDGGRRVGSDIFLVTVPFTALRKILPDDVLYGSPYFTNLSHLQVSPIVAINLWFDRPILHRPFVGFWGTRVHWLFNKGYVFKEGPSYLSLVISGAREELGMAAPQLTEIALQELGRIYPHVGQARLLRSMVTKEPEATMAPAVNASRFRPSQKTPYHNLFLAGDWTDTGLPATIESAVRSAKKAVELIDAEV